MMPTWSRFSFTALFIGIVFGCSLVFLFQDALITNQAFQRIHSKLTDDEVKVSQSSTVDNGVVFYSDETTTPLPPAKNRADELYRKVRVLCWVLTSPEHHATKAKAVKETWGKRCNILLFMSTAEDESLPAVKLNVLEGRNELWGKTREAFRYVWDKYRDEVDWVFKADDDTYAVMENMRYFLSAYNTSKPMWFGHKFKTIVKQGYFSGGAGYVLSKEAVRRFVEVGYFNSLICRHDHQGAEDAEMGKCLSNLNVTAMDTRDSKGRGRFFPFVPEDHINTGKIDSGYWFWTSLYYPVTKGLECCSDTTISFHYVNERQMYVLEYLIYWLRPYGMEGEMRPSTPEPPPDLDLTATPWSVPDDTTTTAVNDLSVTDNTTTTTTESNGNTRT